MEEPQKNYKNMIDAFEIVNSKLFYIHLVVSSITWDHKMIELCKFYPLDFSWSV